MVGGHGPFAAAFGDLCPLGELLATFLLVRLGVVGRGRIALLAGDFSSCSSTSAASAAVRSVVMRIVLAWKNAQRFEASML
jgi:hypothetical protein